MIILLFGREFVSCCRRKTSSRLWRRTNVDYAGLVGVGQVLVSVNPVAHVFSLSATAEANSAGRITKVLLRGSPGYTYRLQRTTQLSGSQTSWIDLAVGSADAQGLFLFSDTNAPWPSFYRAKQP